MSTMPLEPKGMKDLLGGIGKSLLTAFATRALRRGSSSSKAKAPVRRPPTRRLVR